MISFRFEDGTLAHSAKTSNSAKTPVLFVGCRTAGNAVGGGGGVVRGMVENLEGFLGVGGGTEFAHRLWCGWGGSRSWTLEWSRHIAVRYGGWRWGRVVRCGILAPVLLGVRVGVIITVYL